MVNLAGKLFISFLFVPFLLIFLLSISIRFQLLDSGFWTKTYTKYQVYVRLEQMVPRAIELEIKKEGVNQNIEQIKEFAPLFESNNLKTTIEKNIENSVDYMNGMVVNWLIYLPVETLPKGLLPNFLLGENEIPLTTLLSFFSRSQEKTTELPLWVPFIGSYSWTALAITTTIFLVFIFILFTFKALHTGLLISGVSTVVAAAGTNLFLTATEIEWAKETEISQVVLATLGFPILKEVFNLWLYIAVGITLVGIILFITKKTVSINKNI